MYNRVSLRIEEWETHAEILGQLIVGPTLEVHPSVSSKESLLVTNLSQVACWNKIECFNFAFNWLDQTTFKCHSLLKGGMQICKGILHRLPSWLSINLFGFNWNPGSFLKLKRIVFKPEEDQPRYTSISHIIAVFPLHFVPWFQSLLPSAPFIKFIQLPCYPAVCDITIPYLSSSNFVQGSSEKCDFLSSVH